MAKIYDLAGKTAIVTGAAKGIGRVTFGDFRERVNADVRHHRDRTQVMVGEHGICRNGHHRRRSRWPRQKAVPDHAVNSDRHRRASGPAGRPVTFLR